MGNKRQRKVVFSTINIFAVCSVVRKSQLFTTFIRQKMSTQGGTVFKKAKNFSKQFVSAPEGGFCQTSTLYIGSLILPKVQKVISLSIIRGRMTFLHFASKYYYSSSSTNAWATTQKQAGSVSGLYFENWHFCTVVICSSVEVFNYIYS